MHFDERQQPLAVVGAPLALFNDVDVPDDPVLAGKPAFVLQIGGEDILLELRLGSAFDGAPHRAGDIATTKERQPALGQHQHREFARREMVLMPDRRLDIGGQAKGVVAMPFQGQQIG